MVVQLFCSSAAAAGAAAVGAHYEKGVGCMRQTSCLDTAVPCFAALISVRRVDGRRVAWQQVLEQVRE